MPREDEPSIARWQPAIEKQLNELRSRFVGDAHIQLGNHYFDTNHGHDEISDYNPDQDHIVVKGKTEDDYHYEDDGHGGTVVSWNDGTTDVTLLNVGIENFIA